MKLFLTWTCFVLLCLPASASVSGTPGTNGIPVLTTSEPVYGTNFQIHLSSALPNAPMWLLYSPYPGPTPSAYGTLGLGPQMILILLSSTVNSSGEFSINFQVADDPTLFGAPLNLQCSVMDSANPTGFALSNSVNSFFWGCDLDGDCDRDGVVEPDSNEDDLNEADWSKNKGAVFVFNNDDDDSDKKPDAEDNKVNGQADEADLAPILLRPMPDIPSTWTVALTLDADSSNMVRLFKDSGAGWVHFDPSNPIPASELKNGVTLGMEALDFAQTASGAPGKWSGQVLISAILKDGSGSVKGRDDLRFCVSPFILYSNLAPGETTYVVNKSSTTGFINDLRPMVTAAGASLHVVNGLSNSYDRWIQDAAEFGYSTIPSQNGLRMLKTVMRAPRNWSLDSWTKTHCLQPDFGYLYKGWYRNNVDWIDWFGNLDCTPPLPGWPLGRIYTGYQGGTTMHPEIIDFFDAQEVQGPVLQIDTGWLVIGHVDEEISFVPSNVGTEYRMLMPNTLKALKILQDLKSAGKGNLKVFEGTGDQTTVNGLLSWTSYVTYNTNLQPTIDNVRQVMKTNLGIAEADIIDIPALFWKGGGGSRALAHMPNMVNALVLNNHFIACDPFGPKDGGVDKFKEPVIQELSAIGLNVQFIDDWYSYHTLWGEVHCGTNAVRTPPSLPWWNLK